MLEFEAAFRGISKRMAISPESKKNEMLKIVTICKLYLDAGGATYDKNLPDMDIIRAGLRFHARELNELRTSQIK